MTNIKLITDSNFYYENKDSAIYSLYIILLEKGERWFDENIDFDEYSLIIGTEKSIIDFQIKDIKSIFFTKDHLIIRYDRGFLFVKYKDIKDIWLEEEMTVDEITEQSTLV